MAKEAQEKRQETFEECLDKIKQSLDQLNSPDITLSRSMQVYKEGVRELKKAQKILEQAKLEYEEIL